MVSWPFRLGVGHPFGAHGKIFLSFLLPDNCFALRLGAPTMRAGRAYNL
jgi:hypothetical protein